MKIFCIANDYHIFQGMKRSDRYLIILQVFFFIYLSLYEVCLYYVTFHYPFQEYYDAGNKLVRFEMTPMGPSVYGTSPLTQIDDFNTGKI